MAHLILEEELRGGLGRLDIDASPAAVDALVDALARFIELLEKWNQAFNLTAVRDPAEMVTLHVLDSISIAPFLYGVSILDIGTGAGLPGLPLALLEPKRQFTLLDSGGKKIRFVRHVVGELGLHNVNVEHCRIEDYAPADPFDTVVCRAFTSIGDFVARGGGLAASGGRLLAMAGRLPDNELRRLPTGWCATDVQAVDVPGLDAARHVVTLQRG